MYNRRILRFMPLLPILLLALLPACSDSTGPILNDNGGSGQVDPKANAFVLTSVDVPLAEGRFVRLELVGSELELDTDGRHVDLTVAVRNTADVSLLGPVTLWLGPFDPASVFVANPDTSLPVASILPVDGFVYAAEFGPDRLLEPGETSAGKLWRFRTPDQGSFSFGLRAAIPDEPSGSVIAGMCFWDPNRNGVRDPGEAPLVPGEVRVLAPDGKQTPVPVDRDGRYVYPLHVAGLHRVEFETFFDTFAPIAFSTPNPRQVLITPGQGGEPSGFYEAHFGAYTDIPQGPPSIGFTEAPLDSLHRVPWTLIEAEIVNSRHLVCDVGYSGCGPEHVFSLWTDGHFMESSPVQINVVLVHETDEACAAAWRNEYPFDLNPLGRQFLGAYGPGVLVVNLIDFYGNKHKIEWEIGGDQ